MVDRSPIVELPVLPDGNAKLVRVWGMRRETKAVLVGLSGWLAFLVVPALAVGLGWLPRAPLVVETVAVYVGVIGAVAFVLFVLLDIFMPRVRVRWIVAAALVLATASVLALSAIH